MGLRVFNIEPVGKGVLKATLSVDLDNGLVTHFWKVLERDGKLSVCVPQVRIARDHFDALEFEDKEELARIEKAVLEAYQAS